MKYNCEMIRDLLPLYVDQVCSPSSAHAVEEHIRECNACASILGEMSSADPILDQEIYAERSRVLDTQAKFFKRRSAVAGSIIGGIFALPILICLIVNLASGAGLTWFFIVLAAMFIPASLIVVPLMVPENKFLWTIGTFTASLLGLLGVCSIYSGSGWFLIAGPAVLFGLCVIFSPFIVHTKPVAKLLGNQKGLTVFAADTLTFILMMTMIGIRTGSSGFFRIAFACSLMPVAWIWLLFLLIRYPKWNGLLKAAVCILVSALFGFFSNTIVGMMLGSGLYLPKFDLSFASGDSINGFVSWCILLTGTVLAAIFGVCGALKNNRK